MNKKLLMVLSGCLLFLTSCYDDFVIDYYDFTGVYFNKTELPRTAVYGEELAIKAGINLSGDLVFDTRYTAQYEIDNTLLGTKYIPLPTDYYTLSNDHEFVIEKGKSAGYITIKFDEEKFKNDPILLSNAANAGSYALAFKLVDTSADKVIDKLKSQVIPIKYINTYEGNYYQIATIKSASNDDVVIGDEYDYVEAPIHTMATLSTSKVRVKGLGESLTDSFVMEVKEDNTVALSVESGSGVASITADGDCTWDPATRRFTLNYTYTKDGDATVYSVSEILIFRNRTRDGYNEWRWDGFEGN